MSFSGIGLEDDFDIEKFKNCDPFEREWLTGTKVVKVLDAIKFDKDLFHKTFSDNLEHYTMEVLKRCIVLGRFENFKQLNIIGGKEGSKLSDNQVDLLNRNPQCNTREEVKDLLKFSLKFESEDYREFCEEHSYESPLRKYSDFARELLV